jgi:hypothetical protein
VTQVNHSPGVPSSLPTVVASSASPILAGPPKFEGAGIVGTGVISSNQVLYWVSSTGADNVWVAALAEQGKVVTPFKYSTPIVLPTQSGLFP